MKKRILDWDDPEFVKLVEEAFERSMNGVLKIYQEKLRDNNLESSLRSLKVKG